MLAEKSCAARRWRNRENWGRALSEGINVRFWGVRGSVPAPGPHSVRYGGNTACVEVRCGGAVLIFDAGSGIRRLGDVLSRAAKRENVLEQRVDLFLSHAHYDHICGLPFFSPLSNPKAKINIWSGHTPPEEAAGSGVTEKLVRDYMGQPFFPVGPDVRWR